MTDRERLIELLKKPIYPKVGVDPAEVVADFLLDNGVIVLPCKVGDTLWVLWSLTKARKKEVYPVEVYALRYDDKKNNMRVCVEGCFKYHENYKHFYRGTFLWENVGKTVFLTLEEAEKALAEKECKK